MNRCNDRVAIVTGAAGEGMGRSIALTLAREGAQVVINHRTSRQTAEAIAGHIRGRGGNALIVEADIASREGCAELVQTTISHFGRADICVIGPGGGWNPEPPETLNSEGALRDAHDELAPLYYLMPLVLPEMAKNHWGRIIGLSMHAAQVSPAYSYNAAKSARTHALLLAANGVWPKGVTVNVLCPGPVSHLETLQQAVEMTDHGPSWTARKNIAPQDIAEGIAFLCSEAADFFTGNEMNYLFK